MKTGILTLPLHCNYGGIMQAYALQAFLQREGHDVMILDRQRNKKDENLGSRLYQCLCKQVMHRNMQHYIHTHLKLTAPLRSEEELKRAASGLEAVVVGSDQVWRPSMIKGIETNYFLDFTTSTCKRIAYAASFGVDTWNASPSLTNQISELLSRFQAISVREQEGIRLCDEVFGEGAVQVSDPTLLFDKSFYEKLLPDKEQAPSNSLFYYLLGNKKAQKAIIRTLAKRLGLNAYTVNAEREVHIGKFTFAHFPTPDKWLEGFSKARLIVTDSFHGVVFSLLFNKPFIVLSNRSGGLSRITSLLGRYGLMSRLMEKEELLSASPEKLLSLSYDIVNHRIAEDRKFSSEFLRRALSDTSL